MLKGVGSTWNMVEHRLVNSDCCSRAASSPPSAAPWLHFTGTGQTLPVGFIGPLIAITLGIVGLVLDKYCIGICVSNKVYKQGSKYCRGRYWEPAPSIPGIFWSTNEYRHDILQQPEPAGGDNRTTNNCEFIDCSILVFLDCFLSVL